jgi:hypothetical protein
MAITPWQTITTEFGAGKPLRETTMIKMERRDRAAVDHVFEVYFTNATHSGSVYPTFSTAKVTRRVFVPSFGKTFRMPVFVTASAGVSYVHGKLTYGSTTIVSSDVTTSSTTGAYVTMEWLSSLTLLMRQAADLTIEVSSNTTTATTSVSSVFLGARFSWD